MGRAGVAILLGVGLLALSLLLPVPPAAAQGREVVQRIVVEGLQRGTPDSVLAYMLVQEGDAFDEERIDRSIKSLFATGRFANVSIRRDGNTLIVTVVENPTVNRVAFEGNSKLEDDQLQQEVSLKPLGIFTRATVQSDVRRILTLYRRSGRFAATVEPKIIELPQNRVDVVFEINEGPVTGVEKIRFIGNDYFSDSTLLEVIRTRQTRWWRFFSTEDTYDPDRLSLDRELLRRFYVNNGFADFRVDSAVAELLPNRESFIITFVLVEGERYRVGNVAINTDLRGLDVKPLYSDVDLDPGDWFSSETLEGDVNRLTERVTGKGFAFVDVQPKLQRNAEARSIDIDYSIREGPRIFVERIDISGNVRTIDRVIRREFRLAEGDAFNAAKVRRSRQRLQDLDFFEKVTIEDVPGSAPDKTVLKVNVEEKSTGSLSLGAGFSTGSGFLGDITLRERNLLGKGQDLRVSVLVGQRQQQGQVAFTEPYLFDREMKGTANAFYVQTDRQSESSFDSRIAGASAGIGYPLSEHLAQGLSYSFRYREIYDVPSDASVFVKDAEREGYVSEVSHSLSYDRRDSRLFPTSGYNAELTTDVAGIGGDVAYLRNRLDAAYYYPIATNWVVSLSGSVGRILGIGGKDVELLDRYFIGGNEVRGFETDGIGPRDPDTDDALGGEWFYAGSLQLTFPLGLPEELQIRGRTFTDVGSSWKLKPSQLQGVKAEDSSNPRVSAGIGITWNSPFGPLGVDLGWALIKENFDKTELVRVNFGTRF